MWPKKLKQMPQVKMVMTPFPYSVERRESLQKADEMMTSHRIHHLPVMEDGVLVGAISFRDLQRTLRQSKDSEGKDEIVADVPMEGAHVVDLSEPLDRVLAHMAKERLSAALVVKDSRLAGIFTHTDAYQRFVEHLRREFPAAGGDEAA